MIVALKDLHTADPRDLASSLTMTITCLVKTARFALVYADEHEDARIAGSVETTLQVVDELLGVLCEATDFLERDTKRGIWAERGAVVKAETAPGAAG